MRENTGLICTTCGCRHFEVTHTTQVARGVRRRRVCRNCGKSCHTLEILELGLKVTLPPPVPDTPSKVDPPEDLL